MTLYTLAPERGWEFLTAMGTAWNWIQERPAFFPDSGGNQSFEEYFSEAQEADRKQIAVRECDAMVSLITVHLVADGVVEIHVASPRKTKRATVQAALEQIRNSLFDNLGVERIRVGVAVYDGHEHKGTRALAEACGMTATGFEWPSLHDARVWWREYQLTRGEYGASKKRTDERIRLLSETILAGIGRPEGMATGSRPDHRREFRPSTTGL